MFFGAQPFANSAFADPRLLNAYNAITGNRLNFDTDPPAPEPFTAFGDAQLSTVQKQFGTASLFLDGNGDYIQSTNNIDFSSQTSNFTFECWLRPNSTSGINRILQLGPDSYAEQLYYQVNTFTAVVGGSTVLIRAIVSLPTDSWTHIAYVRQGTGRTLYVNGTQVGSGGSANMPQNGKVGIGYSPSAAPTQTWDGYIDEARLSNVVRYTSNFTPATSEFTKDDDTIGLFHFDGTNGSTDIVNSAGADGVIIIGNANVPVTGEEFEFTIGNISFKFVVRVTGVELQVANNTADVIIWNDVPVDPDNNWVAIDPNSVVSYTDINPGATQVWEDIDPLDP